MEKRLILAISLSILIMLLFQKFIQPPAPVRRETTDQSGAKRSLPEGNRPQTTVGYNEILPKTEDRKPKAESQKPLNEIETTFETEKFILTFSNIGGALKDIKLKEFDTTLAKNLETPDSTFTLISPELDPDLSMAEYKVEKKDNKLIYRYEKPNNIRITKEFNFVNSNDYIELGITIENLSDAAKGISYTIIGPSGIENLAEMKGRNFIEADAFVNGRSIKITKPKGGQQTLNGIISWTALKNRYFTIAMQSTNAAEGVVIKESQPGYLSTGLNIKTRLVNPKAFLQDSYPLYMGPLVRKRLSAMNTGMEEIVDYGFFGWISIFLLNVLGFINKIAHNWGVSIILVTILINAVLFPLTKKSFHSMQKMQEVQPHIEKLRQLHKDNPQKLNKEIMELYRQYNVNPFGGCLPMLLQLPIFVAFYNALMRSIELKNANFLWIKDLSSPDAIFRFSNSLPIIGNQLNLLPVLTAVIMFFQQKISTPYSKDASSELAKQQKIMAIFFPIFFGFILYSFPSGLVLYWMTNSILMTIEQIGLRKRIT